MFLLSLLELYFIFYLLYIYKYCSLLYICIKVSKNCHSFIVYKINDCKLVTNWLYALSLGSKNRHTALQKKGTLL